MTNMIESGIRYAAPIRFTDWKLSIGRGSHVAFESQISAREVGSECVQPSLVFGTPDELQSTPNEL